MQTMNPGQYLGDDNPFGESPMVGIKSSASEPLFDQHRTRDGSAIQRNATDIHQGRDRTRAGAVPPRANPLSGPGAAADVQHRSGNGGRYDVGVVGEGGAHTGLGARDATDIHGGRRWRRAVPAHASASFGEDEVHLQAPHMRSTVDSILLGRDIDFSGDPDSEDVEGSTPSPWRKLKGVPWTMKRRASNIHEGERSYSSVRERESSLGSSERAGANALALTVGHEQQAGRRLQQVVFGREVEGSPTTRDGGERPAPRTLERSGTHSFSDLTRETQALDVAHDRNSVFLGKPYDHTYPTSGHHRGKSDILSAESNPYFNPNLLYRRDGRSTEPHIAPPGSDALAPEPNPSRIADLPREQKSNLYKHNQELFPAGTDLSADYHQDIRRGIINQKNASDVDEIVFGRDTDGSGLADADVRHEIVETDIQFFRNPDSLTVKRREQYAQQEAANWEQRARDQGFEVVKKENPYDRNGSFPTGTFNLSSKLYDIHPGSWDKCFQENVEKQYAPQVNHGRRRNRALWAQLP